jgi:hypothetical protein
MQCTQIHFKLLEQYGDDILSYAEVCCWSREFLTAGSMPKMQEGLANFSVQLRIQSALDEMPLTSVQCIAKATRPPATTVFYVLTEVLGLRFRHW